MGWLLCLISLRNLGPHLTEHELVLLINLVVNGVIFIGIINLCISV